MNSSVSVIMPGCMAAFSDRGLALVVLDNTGTPVAPEVIAERMVIS